MPLSRRLVPVALLFAACLAPSVASGAPNAVGTPGAGIVDRPVLDTASNFSVLDTQQVATSAGAISKIDYYAKATGTIRFLVTDSSNKVKYLSPAISVTTTGRKSYSLASTLIIATGDRLGYHTSGQGVIPFSGSTSQVQWSAIPSDPPTVGQTMSNGGNGARIYSFGASGTGLVGHWTFDDSTGSEQTGNWPTFTLKGSAAVANGQLAVDGGGNGVAATAWARAEGYRGPAMTDKTMVAWVKLDTMSVRTGSPLALYKNLSATSGIGEVFDAIDYGEQNPVDNWMAGSDNFRRTSTPFSGAASTTAFQQISISYRATSGGQQVITGCLNGASIGSYTAGNSEGFSPAESPVALFGPRHLSGGNPIGSIKAHIDEARVYNREIGCAGVADTDRDGLIAEADNCPADANPGQTDTDGDGLGDACDPEAIGSSRFFFQNAGQNDGNRCPNGATNNGTFEDRGSIELSRLNGVVTMKAHLRNAKPNTLFVINQSCVGERLRFTTDANGNADGTATFASTANQIVFDAVGSYGLQPFFSTGLVKLTSAGDGDGDGVQDAADNCEGIANANQVDSDLDTNGDACDARPLKYEAERFIGRTTTSNGSLSTQLDCCNLDWSSIGQLIFSGGGATQFFNVPFSVPNAGVYDLTAAVTMANNTGIYGFAVDGTPIGVPSDTFSSTCCSIKTFNYGHVVLSAGTHQLTLRGAGQNPSSASNVAAVDYVELVPTPDSDGDGVANPIDNCPSIANPGQADLDGDGQGDACDNDIDGDGFANGADAFPRDASEAVDSDNDGVGNNADTDDDADGVADTQDAFPLDRSESKDTDHDGIGNNADTDDDADGTPDAQDAFPLDRTEFADTDNDGVGNNADTDDDADGVVDAQDAFPLNGAESVDTDGDGVGNNADTDDDGDGIADANDSHPLDPAESTDTDHDGIGNNADPDDDNDGALDGADAFPTDPSETVDTDDDGRGNNEDRDDDNDGVADTDDAFPLNNAESADTDGDSIGNNADSDDDGDGTPDVSDSHPLDASEQADADHDGIGDHADPDDDNDGALDGDDAFPTNPDESVDTDLDGVGNNADADDDNDGVEDGRDAFPRDRAESVDTDGDGTGNNADSDDDQDGVADVNDAFPLDNAESVDTDHDGTGNNADADDDGDHVADDQDAFPLDGSETADTDNDGQGDNIDPDADNDGVLDRDDAFPLDKHETLDTDHDGTGNNLDTDDDGDDVPDTEDAFPVDRTESKDTDHDGTGNNADTDDDNDGVADSADAFPLDANEHADTDGDGTGNNADTDDDADGVKDGDDAFPLDSAESVDTDGDGTGNHADSDDDGDGTPDASDSHPLDASEKADADHDGIGDNADPDDDNDGALDGADAFPTNPDESVDTDGDGVGNQADTDDDNDGVTDAKDAFPLNSAETTDTDHDGTGNNADADDDDDGVTDARDAFPLNAAESVDSDGDGIGNNADLDDDNDGTPDSRDAFPTNPRESVDTDGDGIGNNADLDDDGDGIPDAGDSDPLNGSRNMPSDKDQCKGDAWKKFFDGSLKFKNQGDCVSYVATAGKNQPAGKK